MRVWSQTIFILIALHTSSANSVEMDDDDDDHDDDSGAVKQQQWNKIKAKGGRVEIIVTPAGIMANIRRNFLQLQCLSKLGCLCLFNRFTHQPHLNIPSGSPVK